MAAENISMWQLGMDGARSQGLIADRRLGPRHASSREMAVSPARKWSMSGPSFAGNLLCIGYVELRNDHGSG